MHKGTVIDKVKGYEIIECESCGFIHINPIPSKQELQRIYEKEYYTTEKPLFIERQLEDIEWWNIIFNDRYDFFEDHLSEDRRKILDIGCGPGFFLKRGMERNWLGVGIEPSKQAAEHARGLGVNVLECFLEQADFKDNTDKFDVVHLSEVLEHSAEPLKVCKTSYSLLSEGGIICVIVPNDYNPFQIVLSNSMGFERYWLAPPHHINYFTFDSLRALLEQAGFKILKKQSMFPIDMFLLMGDNYIGNDKIGRACHAKRKLFEINLCKAGMNDFKKELYEFFASRNIGREIVIFAKK